MRLAPRLLLAVLAVALPAAARAGTPLLDALRAEPAIAAAPKYRIRPATAHRQTRPAIMSAIPNAFAFPLTVPAHARLRVGFTLLDRFVGGDMIERTRPTRFSVDFVGADGTMHPLASQTLDPKARPGDRRWIDLDLDLTPFAGQTGTLRLADAVVGDPEADGLTFALWSSPVVYDPTTEQGGPNLLFITIDALRADHLGAWGYTRPTSPRLDALAAEGVRFANAYTSSSMTVPSLPQIFTSAVFPHSESPNLMSSLAGSDFRSKAIVNNPYLEFFLTIQMRDGFESVSTVRWRADKITRAALRWVDAHKDERFALYLHYLDTHTPYKIRGDAATRFTDPAYEGAVGTDWGDVEGARSDKYDAADRAHIGDLYDGSIRFVDEQIGVLLDGLAARGLLDDTLVVVSADHGEEQWDHGSFFHGQSLYDELLHVPLIMRFPKGAHAGTVVDRQVQSLDIVPTMADAVGGRVLPQFEGQSLLPMITDPASVPKRPLLARTNNPTFPARFAVRTDDQKLVTTVEPARDELYDLAADPKEQHDLLAASPPATIPAPLADAMAGLRGRLRDNGVQVRAVAGDGRDHTVEVRVHSAEGRAFENPDRIGFGPSDHLVLDRDGRTLVWTATVGDTQPKGVRFDRGHLRDPVTDPGIEVQVSVDGQPIAPSALRLGGDAAAAPSAAFTYKRSLPALFGTAVETPALEATTPPALTPQPDQPVTVYLWRTREEGSGALSPPPANSDTQDRLRALGYVH
ncbi:MAG TPA: sulfatase [Candidatus Binatia bacterium]|jgi:arylsulfatase A-like enzyme|nr:sulfatase [Candidatus Binatia bacterium]